MATDISEALVEYHASQLDGPDDMFELLTGLALADGNAAAAGTLLRNKCLPFELAEKLVARHDVTAADLAAFVSRDDVSVETLQDWVRNERRVTVLTRIAEKTDLPTEVYEMLATRKGVALRQALLFNESVPVEVRAGVAVALFNSSKHRDRRVFDTALNDAGGEPLQRAVFDRLTLTKLIDCQAVSAWQGLETPQLHRLFDVIEQLAGPATPASPRPQLQTVVNFAWGVASHAATDGALLDRLGTFRDGYDNPSMWNTELTAAIASARQLLAAFGGDYGSVVSASHSKLVELADSGVLCTPRLAELVVTNPLFDADVAVKMLEGVSWSPRPRLLTRVLVEWVPDLLTAVRIQRVDGVLVVYRALDRHIREASTDELLAALDTVADDPEWNRILAVRYAVAAAEDTLTDEVVGRFCWFPDREAFSEHNALGVRSTEFLRRRFGDHVPTWLMFAAVADSSTPLAEAADLAVHTEPPPNPPTPNQPSEQVS